MATGRLAGVNLIDRPQPRRRLRRLALAVLILLGLALLALEGFGWFLAGRQPVPAASPPAEGIRENRERALQTANAGLRKKLAGLVPQETYVVVDTARNRVFLRQGGVVQREMVASCGSGNVLEDPVGGRKWVFDTPRGEFKVQSKVTDPIWIKPDWAFIEEGEPIPANSSARAEAGMMGDYAIGIGRGYFIHGTLYKRLLGRNVSHGCIRLGDEDLKTLYDTAAIGKTRVVIF